MVMEIIGLMIKTVPIRMMMANHQCLSTARDIPIPNETKNRSEKKSLRLFIFPMISTRYSRVPRVRPATNAPIASENPKY